jgi:hypothetical protein
MVVSLTKVSKKAGSIKVSKKRVYALAVVIAAIAVACGGPETAEGTVSGVKYLPEATHKEKVPNTTSKCTDRTVTVTKSRVVNGKTKTYNVNEKQTECSQVRTGGFHYRTEIDRQARHCVALEDQGWYTVLAVEYNRVSGESGNQVELEYLHEGC